MRITGIIMECNPFHKGHQYILDSARKECGADYVVVVLSGDYVQRGIPAVMSKETRTRDVLNAGADLVLELPVCYATGDASTFAQGAIRMLTSLSVTTDIAFGSLVNDLHALEQAADLLDHETPAFKQCLQEALAEGRTYPAARATAAKAALGISLPTNGNDILAIEYVRALNNFAEDREIQVHPVPRIDTDSATTIRERLLQEQQATVHASLRSDNDNYYMCADDFSDLLYYRLNEIIGLSGTDDAACSLRSYYGVDRELSHRIPRLLPSYESWTGFAADLKTRNITYSRVSRALLHILLHIRQADVQALQAAGGIGYARILGFRRSAGPLLSAINEQSGIPLVTSPSAALGNEDIPSLFHAQLHRDLAASELYDYIIQKNRHGNLNSRVCELTKQMIIL